MPHRGMLIDPINRSPERGKEIAEQHVPLQPWSAHNHRHERGIEDPPANLQRASDIAASRSAVKGGAHLVVINLCARSFEESENIRQILRHPRRRAAAALARYAVCLT